MANKQWRRNQGQDQYFRKAKAEGYRARSVYKFTEINTKFRLVRPGDRVLDIGAAPGSWSQAVREIVGPRGQVIAVDIQEMRPIEGVTIIQGDIRDEAVLVQIETITAKAPFHAVISDIAPNTTGIAVTDHARSIELSLFSFVTAVRLLKPGGHFVTKVFRGTDFDALVRLVKRYFRIVKVVSPDATRKESKEAFMVAHELKVRADLDPNAGLEALLEIVPTPFGASQP